MSPDLNSSKHQFRSRVESPVNESAPHAPAAEQSREPDMRTTRLVRIGLLVMLAYQMAHLLFTVAFARRDLTTGLWTLHFFNIASTVVVMSLTWSDWYQRRWRELVFADCAAMVLSAVAVSAMTAESSQFFIATVLLQLGTAALIPWGLRWQAALSAVCAFAALLGVVVIPGEISVFRWLEFGTAVGLSLFVAALAERYRIEIQLRFEALEGNERRLWKIFEENPDAVTVARLSDGRYVNVSAQFLQSGYTREDALKSSDAELHLWADEREREEYWRQVRGQGYVRNMEALLRRKSGPQATTTLKVGDLELDLLGRRARRAGREIDLTSKEFTLLEFLVRRAGQVVTRTMLLEGVWDLQFDPQTNLIDVHISRLRQAVDRGFDRALIHTVRGAGYVVRDDGTS